MDDSDWKQKVIKERLGGKEEWTQEERLELCHQLDKDLENQLSSMERKPKEMEDSWTEENWKEKMGEHPIFAPYLEENQGKTEIHAKVNSLSEGLAQLKYSSDHNTPLEIATVFKDDGIDHFKFKKYRLAKANFTEGLKQNFTDDNLKAQLFNNRAAADLFLENYRSAIKDCDAAIKLKPDYSKAISRAIQCAVKLKSWEEVISWCDKGLQLNLNDDSLIKQKKIAAKEMKVLAAQNRKKDAKIRRENKIDQQIHSAILDRKISLEVDPEDESTDGLPNVKPTHSMAVTSPVHICESGNLVWPVLFLYPEVNQHDCVLEFDENHSFLDHLDYMFDDPTQPPPDWDSEGRYKSCNLDVYFIGTSNDLIKIDLKSTLRDTLSDQRYLVRNGTPEFVILIKNSQYTKHYIAQKLKK